MPKLVSPPPNNGSLKRTISLNAETANAVDALYDFYPQTKGNFSALFRQIVEAVTEQKSDTNQLAIDTALQHSISVHSELRRLRVEAGAVRVMVLAVRTGIDLGPALLSSVLFESAGDDEPTLLPTWQNVVLSADYLTILSGVQANGDFMLDAKNVPKHDLKKRFESLDVQATYLREIAYHDHAYLYLVSHFRGETFEAAATKARGAGERIATVCAALKGLV